MDYNMVCFFNFDLKKGEEIYFDEDETTYTLVGDIELLPEYNNFEGVFATYPIRNILDYMNIDKYSVDYVARQLRVDVPRSMLRCNGEYVENVEEFINYLEWKGTTDDFKAIGLFCSQVVFAYPITQIQLRLNERGDDLYICELMDKRLDGYLTDVSLYTIDGKLEYNILICKKLRLCHIPPCGEPETVYKFSLIIKICDDFYNVDIVID